MRCLNQYAICAAILITLSAGFSHAAHMYYIGTLTSYADNQMVLDGNNYHVAPNVKVILRVVGSNGAIHEQTGRLSDIRVGNNITIKVSNGLVTEVEIVVSR